MYLQFCSLRRVILSSDFNNAIRIVSIDNLRTFYRECMSIHSISNTRQLTRHEVGEPLRCLQIYYLSITDLPGASPQKSFESFRRKSDCSMQTVLENGTQESWDRHHRQQQNFSRMISFHYHKKIQSFFFLRKISYNMWELRSTLQWAEASSSEALGHILASRLIIVP